MAAKCKGYTMIHDLKLIENINVLYENKVVLYGAGFYGKKTHLTLRNANIETAFFCDEDPAQHSKMCEGTRIISPQELSILDQTENIVIIITPKSMVFIEQIVAGLVERKIKTDNVFTRFGFETAFWQNINNLRLNKDMREYYQKVLKGLQTAEHHHWIYSQMKLFLSAMPNDILVYQPAKVGSSTVHESLLKRGVGSLHLHRLAVPDMRAPELEDIYKSCGKQIVKQTRKIITLVREPLSRELSCFFQRVGWSGVAALSYEDTFLNYCIKYMNGRCMEHLTDEVYLDQFDWFDRELKAAFQVDVYDSPFDREKGYSIITQTNVEVLVMKMEKLAELEQVIGDFVGLADFKLVKKNVGSEKPYKYLYKNAKEAIRIPQLMMDKYYLNNPHMDHFYTEAEKVEFLRNWEIDT